MDISRYIVKDKIWTLSNIFSFARLFMAVFLFYFIYTRHTYVATFLAILAVISDYADGYAARRRNEVTELGKILDPVADKVSVGLSAVALHLSYGLPLWMVIVIVGRDILILIGSLFLMDKVKAVAASQMPGKIAVTVIAMLLLSYLFEFHNIKNILIILTILAIIYSFTSYLIRFLRIMGRKTDKKEAL
ncbi:MAG: CDP-alcohol phosphatidyltransferase family protein [Calditrichaeota bacterium]|nr:CDP-alcohol phosphatidyltransferase family protein [Calditrichota bacterium]RQW08127.1 MAG: CDP-alcohol phosphatidyltransferase family protein [Calditrichota bacterium]